MRLRLLRSDGWLMTMWSAFGNWSNVEIYTYKKLEIRRIDVLLVLLGCSIAIYYLIFYSWQMSLLGLLLYIMAVMCALWML